LEHEFNDFPYIGNNHPNWRAYFSEANNNNYEILWHYDWTSLKSFATGFFHPTSFIIQSTFHVFFHIEDIAQHFENSWSANQDYVAGGWMKWEQLLPRTE
jgi:hypothetical protein